MTKKYLWFLFVMIVLANHHTQAQNLNPASDALVWNVSSAVDLSTNSPVSMSSVFKTDNQKVEWIQDGGNHTYEYSVSAINGSWPVFANDGEVVYNVSWNDLNGTLRFHRADGQLMIDMNFQKNGKNIMPFQFLVTSVTKNN